MITREQFEAHVRAEAEKRYDMRWNEYRHLQNAYIAARMEHEWPLVEALQDIIPIAQRMQAACDDGDVLNFDNEFDMADAVDYHSRLVKAQAALSPYTTKPIS